MKTKIITLFCLCFFSISGAFAHALWIETSSTGKKGQAQEIKIFFGEYESKELDSASKWFSNLKAFSLVLTDPNGKTKILPTTAEILNYKASFVPDQDGLYLLSIIHEVATVYEHAKIEYYAFTNVAIGNAQKLTTSYPENALLNITPSNTLLKKGISTHYIAKYKGNAFAKQKLTVILPNGKQENPVTDENGQFIFTPEQKGNYLFEAFTEEKTLGLLNGKDYEKIWHLVTVFSEVK